MLAIMTILLHFVIIVVLAMLYVNPGVTGPSSRKEMPAYIDESLFKFIGTYVGIIVLPCVWLFMPYVDDDDVDVVMCRLLDNTSTGLYD